MCIRDRVRPLPSENERVIAMRLAI
jgi:hypothetical protein